MATPPTTETPMIRPVWFDPLSSSSGAADSEDEAADVGGAVEVEPAMVEVTWTTEPAVSTDEATVSCALLLVACDRVASEDEDEDCLSDEDEDVCVEVEGSDDEEEVACERDEVSLVLSLAFAVELALSLSLPLPSLSPPKFKSGDGARRCWTILLMISGLGVAKGC